MQTRKNEHFLDFLEQVTVTKLTLVSQNGHYDSFTVASSNWPVSAWIKVAEFKARVNGVICLPKKLSEIQDLMNKVLFQGYIQHSALAYNWKSPLILSALLLQREQHDINFPSITN